MATEMIAWPATPATLTHVWLQALRCSITWNCTCLGIALVFELHLPWKCTCCSPQRTHPVPCCPLSTSHANPAGCTPCAQARAAASRSCCCSIHSNYVILSNFPQAARRAHKQGRRQTSYAVGARFPRGLVLLAGADGGVQVRCACCAVLCCAWCAVLPFQLREGHT